jgi:hypothetical protein
MTKRKEDVEDQKLYEVERRKSEAIYDNCRDREEEE